MHYQQGPHLRPCAALHLEFFRDSRDCNDRRAAAHRICQRAQLLPHVPFSHSTLWRLVKDTSPVVETPAPPFRLRMRLNTIGDVRSGVIALSYSSKRRRPDAQRTESEAEEP